MTEKSIMQWESAFQRKILISFCLEKPVFMDDIIPKDCLIVKLLRSPHAHAIIEEINTAAAMKVPGIVAVYTWKDVPQRRFSIAGSDFSGAISL